MKNRNLVIMLAGALLVTSQTSRADSTVDVLPNVPEGVYIEATGGYSYVGGGVPTTWRANNDVAVINSTLAGEGLGYNINLGYEFTNNIGVEVGLSSYAPQSGSIDATDLFRANHRGDNYEIATLKTNNAHMYDVAGRFSLPFNEKTDVFAKFGASYMSRSGDVISEDVLVESQSFSDQGFGVLYGIGFDYNFTKHAAWTTQATGATPFSFFGNESQTGKDVELPSMFLISTGIKYTF